jgi:hypothetical protein
LRVLEIRPDAPLASETDYEVIVVDGDLLSALGAVIAEGPRDLVGRILAAPFALRFRTATRILPACSRSRRRMGRSRSIRARCCGSPSTSRSRRAGSASC